MISFEFILQNYKPSIKNEHFPARMSHPKALNFKKMLLPGVLHQEVEVSVIVI